MTKKGQSNFFRISGGIVMIIGGLLVFMKRLDIAAGFFIVGGALLWLSERF